MSQVNQQPETKTVESQSHTPVDVEIKPRNRKHDIAEALKGDWYDSNVFKTAWFNSMSITFPLGEKFFIDSVRYYADQVTDPKLIKEIKGFCGQENVHRREHELYNKTLCDARGYDLDYLEGRIAKNIKKGNEIFGPMELLASTAAAEHITAIMAEWALDKDSTMSTETDPVMRDLWHWHAAEEMEHKSVACDVYRVVGGTEKMRIRALRRTSIFLLIDIFGGMFHMLRRDKQFWKLSTWTDGYKFLFGKKGVIRLIWPAYKDYNREGFHPWDRNTKNVLEQWVSEQTPAQTA